MKNYKFMFLLFLFTFSLEAKELKKLTLQLSWFDQFQFAGYYMAKEKGYYEKLGLDVEIIPFKFGLDIANDVSTGKTDFAIGRETLILDKIKGANIVALSAIFQASPLVLISTDKSKIKSIKDFTNKKIMTTIDDAGEVSLKAMIKSNNITVENLQFLKHSHNIMDLVNNKTDVISAYISKAPFELQKLKVSYNIFAPKDYGFDMYSDFLFTSNKLLNEKKELVKAFKKASLLGWEYAYSNIEESVDLIYQNYNSQKLKKDELIYEGQELKKLSYLNNKKLGNIELSKVQRIYDLYNIMGLVKNKIDLKTFIFFEKTEELDLSLNQLEYLKNNHHIKYCVVPNALPYSAIKNKKFEGLSSEVLKEIEKKLKINFTLIPTVSLQQSLEFLKEKKCDLIPNLDINEERKTYLDFSSSYMKVPLVFVTKNSVAFVDNMSNLKNKRIAVLKNFYLFKNLQKNYPNIDFIEVKNVKEAFALIDKGEVFSFISSFHTAWNKLKSEYITKLKISGKLTEEYNLRFATRQDEQILKEILSLAILEIDKKELDMIQNKWLFLSVKEKFDYELLFQIFVVTFIVFILLLYRQKLLKELNKNLNIKVKEKTQALEKINEDLEERITNSIEEWSGN